MSVQRTSESWSDSDAFTWNYQTTSTPPRFVFPKELRELVQSIDIAQQNQANRFALLRRLKNLSVIKLIVSLMSRVRQQKRRRR
jgi:hypothetical protein